MTDIVAIDIETTGLDAARDAIIEIGAVRFRGGRVEAEWTNLMNSGMWRPGVISNLTGITDEMVRGAPSLGEVLSELEAFAGDLPLLGHNVRFDLGFLQKKGLFAYNQVIDTYELAAVLMPQASRYNLGALGQQLGILLPATHRALDDARVTHGVYVRLFERALELPFDLLEEIMHHAEPLDWDAAWTFDQVLRAKAQQGVQSRGRRGKGAGGLFAGVEFEEFPPLQPRSEPVALDPEETAAVLEYGGPFSDYFEAYEHRPEQVEMLRAITHALSDSRHLMVEAGTGVGKSFAYLVPAALWAMQNGTRVVISTNTLNLQDQLIKKDIPDLRAALNLDLHAAVLKGRSNYLCPRRLQHLREHGPANAEELRVLAKLLVWLQDNQSGDRNEINLTGPVEREIWTRLSAEDDGCTTETCLARAGGSCPFYRARQAAQSAHILVVNHALLLADIATGSKVLPEYHYLIVDEAHHLESATTDALSFRLTQNDFERMLREVGGTSSGTIGRLLAETHESLRPSDFALLSQQARRATDLAFRLQEQARDFFFALGEFMAAQRDNRPPSNYAYQERVLSGTRTQPGWDDIEMAWSAADDSLRLLINGLNELYKASGELYADGFETLEDVMGDLSNVLRRLVEAEINITALISEPSEGQIYWVEIRPDGNRLALQAAPLHVGPLIQKHLWHEKNAVVLTSATLTTRGTFDYMRNTLSAAEADELALGSPFDYESSTLLFLSNDIPEPNAPGYQQALDRALLRLAQAAGGRTLVLFTSYAQLKRSSQAISPGLSQHGIAVYEQGEGASPNALVESFKESERAVLLGTRSFWEGVDIPGQALSVVVIPKLPFDVPSDPLIAARSETYEDPFNEYYLPEAILKFRQGFGRLIRTQADRGVVALLDRRLLTKQYGRFFLESLPGCTARQGPLNDLPRLAAKWLE